MSEGYIFVCTECCGEVEVSGRRGRGGIGRTRKCCVGCAPARNRRLMSSLQKRRRVWVNRICVGCGQEFIANRTQKRCKRRCGYRNPARPRVRSRVKPRSCVNCGINFTPLDRLTRFCTRSCRTDAERAARPVAQTPQVGGASPISYQTCHGCRRLFVNSKNPATVCSVSCAEKVKDESRGTRGLLKVMYSRVWTSKLDALPEGERVELLQAREEVSRTEGVIRRILTSKPGDDHVQGYLRPSPGNEPSVC